MSARSIEGLKQYLRRLCDEASPPEDAVLLSRFVTANDREAFELLVARHGPMVLGTARRLVDHAHDAEDVFQAVFLSLARLANTIRQGGTLPAWLHKATCRVAAKVRKKRIPGPKEKPPEPSEQVGPEAELAWREVRQALDEELQRLPERLRSPLLLCYLSGLTRDEAAKQLGWSLGTLKRRMEEGRKALRDRLDRRGIGVVSLALTVLAPETLQAAVSQSLFDSSLDMIFSPGPAVPATVSSLVLNSSEITKGLAMKSLLAALITVGVGVGLYAGAGQADPPKKAEEKKEDVKPTPEDKVAEGDDPLPAGSALRFGTARFRYGWDVKTLAVSPDGKAAFATNDNHLPVVFDLGTGRVRFTMDIGSIEVGKYSPDGKALVLRQGYDLYVRDAATGKELRTIHGPRTDSWGSQLLEVTPDGKAVAVTSRQKFIHLIDFETGNAIRDFSLENPESALPASFAGVQAVAFTPDGKRMASGGYENDKDNYFARIWDVETGKELRRAMLGKAGYGVGCLAFSPDGKTLATLGTQAGVILRLFDVETGKERKAFPKDGDRRTEPGSIAFSPDGKTVAAARGSVRLYDTATGEERLCIDQRASHLHFTDGGKTLTGAVSGAIYRWDTATGKLLTPEAGDSAVEQVLVSADGRRVVTRGQGGDAHIWDGATGKHLRRFEATLWQSGMAISPDGRLLAWPIDDDNVTFTVPQEPRSNIYGSRVRLYDIAADKVIDRFPAFKGAAQDVAFTGDGKKLVNVDSYGGTVRIWDVEAGKEERSFSVMLAAPKGKVYRVHRPTLSPGGRVAALTYEEADTDGIERLGRGLIGPPQIVRLWDVASGKERPPLDGGDPIAGAFSPDGRLVVTHGGNFVFETATGRRVAALPDEPYVWAAAFSRDGRLLATAITGGVIQLWEVATWTKRNEFKGYEGQSVTLAFGPGGRLFTGNVDTTTLAWDTKPPRAAASVSLESAWADLATREAAVSFRTAGRFLATPAETVKLFAVTIKPAAALDPKRVQRLIADLGADEFAVREAASKALLDLDEQAVPHLEAALTGAASAEVRDRVKRILDQKRATPLALDQLRQLRGVTVLEQIADGDAKALLKKWAAGPVGAMLTTEAAAALQRLGQ